MNIIDWLIIIIILLALFNGFRKGVINSVVTFIGTLLVFVLAFYLKNPISVLLYEYLPFFKLTGRFEGISVVNVLIYEGISYLVTISLLAIILKIIAKVTGAVNALLNATLVLGIPSKILGAGVGFFQGYIISFIIIFILGLISGTSTMVNQSKYAEVLMEKTPLLSNIVDDTYNSVKEVYNISSFYQNEEDKDEANLKSLDILLKYEILDIASADKLIEKEKITAKGAKEIIDKHRKEN
ncbi:MAG: CvpA family protein [Bacilli bacterium]|nr:CvpA family protein [Bacilli bacterium]